MANFNSVVLVGRLTRDVELKQIPNSETIVGDFGLAVNEQYGEKEYANFFDLSIWGKQAETLAKYCHKGDLVLVNGRLRYESWDSDGQKRSKVSVKVDNFQFLEPPPASAKQEAAAKPVNTNKAVRK
jgi:single-strand DNA-binding protein